MRFIIALGVLCMLAAGWPPSAAAQSPDRAETEEPAAEPPEAEPPEELRRPKPDLSELERLRFVTDSDYPPFNYLDEEGALTGLNVDLARALCDELSVECDVTNLDWSELVPAVEQRQADAVIASIRTSEESLLNLDFTDPYYHTPARFVAPKDSPLSDTSPTALRGKRIAVAAGTAHEAFLRDFYAESEIVVLEDVEKAREALQAGKADILFGDGIGQMFWLNGTLSEDCCAFRGGPYAESKYFGEGVGIAVRRGDRKLRVILNYGLSELRRSGRLEELYRRYFPLSFF